MPTTSPPILVWTPGGGFPVGPIAPGSSGPVYSQAGTTQLIEGQAYIDVVFGSVQTTDEWVLVECVVVNEIDAEPLNIWPGIITDKTTSGFRLQLNGMPDSGNYSLHWAVSGVNITPTPATTFTLTGATSGFVGVPITFTLHLPASTTGTATITPSDSGGGGAFSPTSVNLHTGEPSTFTYTPGSSGSKTISVTNTGGLLNPADITVTVVPSATGYSLAGPSGGTIGVASTAFTVTLTPGGGAVPAPVTITPSDSGGGGTFTPTTVSLTTVAPSTTFTYTPASAGAKTISATNDGGLTNPGSLTYTAAPFAPSDIAGLKGWWKADALALSDSAAVNPWTDSSGGGFDLALYVSAPIFKTSIVNGKPVVRFDGASNALETTADSIPSSYTVFAVAKAASISAAAHSIVTFGSTSFSNVILRRDTATLNFYQLTAPATYANVAEASGIASGTWNYFTANWDGANIHLWRNGTLKGTSVATTIQTTGSHLGVGFDYQSGAYWDGDIAEVLVYDSALGTTDRQNVEAYLAAKYGL